MFVYVYVCMLEVTCLKIRLEKLNCELEAKGPVSDRGNSSDYISAGAMAGS